MALATRRARLTGWQELAPEVRHFVFETEDGAPLEFTPGQFVSFSADIGEKRITRAYSLAGPPAGSRFELCLNRVEDGLFSPYLFDLAPGAVVDMKGPLGGFVMRSPVSDSVFVATGTGIAPFRAMIPAAVHAAPERHFTLLFGVRHEHGLHYRDEFERLAREHANFVFWPTLTQPGPAWTGRTGRVQAHLPEAVEERRDIDLYICGLKAMVDSVRAMLKEMGFERRRIIYEKYD